jgi:hypothetical protein
MRSHLKVKVRSFMAEMHGIHRDEIKWKAKAKAARQREKQQADTKTAGAIQYCENNFWSLRWHRAGMKSEARWSHLAYGFFRGRAYQQMENICYGEVEGYKGYNREAPNWGRIEEIITKFSKDEPNMQDIMQRFGAWRAAAVTWYEGNEQRIPAFKAANDVARNQRIADPAYQAQRQERNRKARESGIASVA